MAEDAVEVSRQVEKKKSTLRGRTLINLFFEASTRTQASFELAGTRLGSGQLLQLEAQQLTTRGNPVGTNAEITGALLGDNIGQVKVALPVGATVNGRGEMCDLWGTPYFFHQLSGTRMEIRSAGPDRRLWTADDVAR